MQLPPDLAEDLELTCIDTIRGDPPGPGLAARLARNVKAVLLSRGIQGRVEAKSDRNGTFVTLFLPTPEKTVQRVVLQLHPRYSR